MAIDNIHEAVRDVLVNDAGVSAITTVVKPWMLWRTDELPAITYSNVNENHHHAYDQTFAWKQRRIQYDCWGNKASSGYTQAHDLAAAVVAAVNGERHTAHGNVYIHRLRVEDVADLPKDPNQGDEQPPYAVRVDVVAAYELTA